MVEDGIIIYDWVVKNKPKQMLEIGCGASTIITSLALRDSDNLDVEYVSLDIDKNRIGETEKLFKTLGKSPTITALNIESLEFLTKNGKTNSVDFIFLDSSHEFKQTLLELLFTILMLKPNGALFIHDTKIMDVISAIYVILKHNPSITFRDYNTKFGLGVIQLK